jgi:predicted ATPase
VPLPGDLRLPATVQGVLAARIDRLPPDEKSLLQTLAVIGKEFSLGLLKKVIDQTEDNLLRQLSRLQTSEFVYERPAFPDIEYTFKHALTQEVAYNSLLIERRKVVHERAAQALEEIYRYKLDDRYSELAHHYSRSGNTQKAVDYLQLAGQQAVQRSAYTEAINHLTLALDLLKTQANTPERLQKELALQLSLGVSLQASRGFTAAEIEATYARARELCRDIGNSPQLFPVLRGLWQFYVTRAESKIAREIGEPLLRLAQNNPDPVLLSEAYHALGATLYFQGEFPAARQYLERSLALYDPQHAQTLAIRYGYDSKVGCLVRLAHVLWHLGYPDQGLNTLDTALSYAQKLAHPPTLGVALMFVTFFHSLRRDSHRAREGAEALIAYSTERGLSFFLIGGIIQRGWALGQQGQADEGLAELRHGLSLYDDSGTGVRVAYFIYAAETYARVGQLEESFAFLVRARSVLEEGGEELWSAEIYRLQGELTLQQQFKVPSSEFKVPNTQHPTPSTQVEVEQEAEGYFLKAIDIAQKQQAKSLELRAVMSLVRLRQQQASEQRAGSREQGARNTQYVTRTALAEAHRLLSGVYSWFTEGFETKDLQEAKALLKSLASS